MLIYYCSATLSISILHYYYYKKRCSSSIVVSPQKGRERARAINSGNNNNNNTVIIRKKAASCPSSPTTTCSSRRHPAGLTLTAAAAAAAAAGLTLLLSLSMGWANAEELRIQVQNQEVVDAGTLLNIPQMLSGECVSGQPDCNKSRRIQRPKSRQAESCTIKCVTTCIRGGFGSPGEGPLNVRRPLVVFKQGFRSRHYCLVECSDICNLIKDGDDGP